MRTLLTTLLTLGVVSLATACGAGDSGDTAADDPMPGLPEAAAEEPPGAAEPIAAPSFDSAHTWTFSGKNAEGGTWDVTLAAGRLVSGAEVNTMTDPVLGAVCQVDPQTDAVVPYQLRMTSTTAGGFDVEAGYQFLLTDATFFRNSPPLTSQPPAGFAVARSGGCLEAGPAMTLGGVATLGPGEESLSSGLMVLRGWASPNHPDGNPELLSNVWLGAPSTAVLTSATWVNERADGPALLDLRDPDVTRREQASGTYTYWQFPLDGSSKPNCDEVISPPFSGISLDDLCREQVR